MAELLLHGRPVETVFDLIGHDENSMTAALGWGLARNRQLLVRFADFVAPGSGHDDSAHLELQGHDQADRGFTDIELLGADLHVIVEAKKGWDPPTESQLRRYASRFSAARPDQHLVILTQNGAEKAVRHLLGAWEPPSPIRLHVIAWSDVVALVRRTARAGKPDERRVAAELATYLRRLADMRDTQSNLVYVVALSTQGWDKFPLMPIEVVEKAARYFFPATGKNWPKSPPNYIGFRYWGRLQSVHHVDGYAVIDRWAEHFPGAPDQMWPEPHFLLKLGPAIRPDHAVRTGPGIKRAARIWADIDLLLTSSTITQARSETKRRHGEGTES